MSQRRPKVITALFPGALASLALVLLTLWIWQGNQSPISKRVPGTDNAPGGDLGTNGNAVLAGKLFVSDGKAASIPGSWPQFRGPGRDGISPESGLLRSWQPGEPRELWGLEVGEGYAGPAVSQGRVYLMDYDREKKQDALRCLSLADGREIWRFAYPVAVKRNHGMSRTVPSVSEKLVIAIGPKCHVVCLDAILGELKWGLDLVREYGTVVPPWYAGQCPLIEGDKLILAPAGKNALLVALEAETGKVLWKTANTLGWKMTHSSIMPMDFGGERIYVYCGSGGVAGVSARTGEILWHTTDWKISIATVPTPVILDSGRIFLSGGYNAGSLMLQLKKEGEKFAASTVFKLEPEVFGATQQSPVLFESHLYGVRPDGKFTCLTPEGKALWNSGSGQDFGLGAFLSADGMIFAINDSGLLRLLSAKPDGYQVLSQAQILKGRECWGSLALAGKRLLVRDLTRLVCLEVGR